MSKALYETLTTYDGADQTKPQAGLAEYTMSPEGNWLTLRLRSGRVFSDGSAVTSDDVVFTLERVKGLRGAAASILGNVVVRKVDERTLTLTSPDANFALPAILANPAFGILNSRAVKANGGTIGPGDTADAWLATNSAGSGPYVLSGADDDEVRLTVSPTWAGTRPAFPEVVVRDAAPDGRSPTSPPVRPTSCSTCRPSRPTASPMPPRGRPARAGRRCRSWRPVRRRPPSSCCTATPRLNAWTGNPDFAEAVRLGIDREAVATAVSDAIPAAGVIPVGIVGSLLAPTGCPPAPRPPRPGDGAGTLAPTPAPSRPRFRRRRDERARGRAGARPRPGPRRRPCHPPVVPDRDLPGARAALARSGYAGQRVPLTFASDLPIQGVPTASVAATRRGAARRGRHQRHPDAAPGREAPSSATAPAATPSACGAGPPTTPTPRTTSPSPPVASSACAPAGRSGSTPRSTP